MTDKPRREEVGVRVGCTTCHRTIRQAIAAHQLVVMGLYEMKEVSPMPKLGDCGEVACVGYPKCDGNLGSGEPHEKECPAHSEQSPTQPAPEDLYQCDDCLWHGCGLKSGGCQCECHRKPSFVLTLNDERGDEPSTSNLTQKAVSAETAQCSPGKESNAAEPTPIRSEAGEGLARLLPSMSKRVETGPVQFGDDWPGLFIRGDNCVNIFHDLKRAGISERSGLAELFLSPLVGPIKSMALGGMLDITDKLISPIRSEGSARKEVDKSSSREPDSSTGTVMTPKATSEALEIARRVRDKMTSIVETCTFRSDVTALAEAVESLTQGKSEAMLLAAD